MFATCAATAVEDAKVYTVGGDTIDTATFIQMVEELLPGAAKLITTSGGSLPIASKIDDAALRADYPTILRIPIRQGIQETISTYQKLEHEGRLTV